MKNKIILSAIFISLGITVNFIGFNVANYIIFPLYLDSLLTISVVAICGFIPGFICALGSNLLFSIVSESSLLFSICHISTVSCAWIVFSRFNKKNPHETYTLDCFLWIGIYAALTNGFLGNTIADFVYAADTGRPSATIMIQCLYGAISNLTIANTFGGILENIADKIFSTLISYAVYTIFIKIKQNNK